MVQHPATPYTLTASVGKGSAVCVHLAADWPIWQDIDGKPGLWSILTHPRGDDWQRGLLCVRDRRIISQSDSSVVAEVEQVGSTARYPACASPSACRPRDSMQGADAYAV